ncbi:serpin B6-like isoform X1 [Poeciliopsis prolifica]|uniref:serpin B6-like isoform X1 n=1 Tax=Poeciliopsis prolifica TaxID=188132 RepID=UPI002412F226|nr:serpin B6-like isoform X1 [Poeciliopsis prolifica]
MAAEAAITPLASANTSFSLALLKKLGDKDNTANVFFSPFSISSALAMVLLGARGNTAAQMSEVLGFTQALTMKQAGQPQMQMQSQMQMQQKGQTKLPPQLLKTLKTLDVKDDLHTSFGQLLSQLNKSDAPYALNVANRLYGEKSYKFVQDYLESTKKHYKAELETVDFTSNAEAARVNINGWVETKTQGKIKDLLAQNAVNSLTRLVLVNAIYFKGHWDKQFKVDATRDAQFSVSKNSKKPVKMMHMKSKFPLTYISEVDCQVLEMPYKGKELSMLIFLPQNMEGTTGLEKLEQALTYAKFMDWTNPDMMDMIEVQVGLPRFKLEEKYDMKAVLQSMGMVDAFDQSSSDFSGMSPANDLFVSEVYHKAFVEVNEEGTEAAAATAAVMMVRCIMIPATFIADHPFLFFIRHNPSKSVLFAGRYCSPV